MSLISEQIAVIRCVSSVLLASGSLLFFEAGIHARHRGLTQEEARELTIAALDPTARQLPKLGLDLEGDAADPDYYRFEVTWGNPKGSVVVGHFGVSRATGDVWKLIPCEKVTSSELEKLQGELRKRIGLSRDELRKVRTRTQPCEP